MRPQLHGVADARRNITQPDGSDIAEYRSFSLLRDLSYYEFSAVRDINSVSKTVFIDGYSGKGEHPVVGFLGLMIGYTAADRAFVKVYGVDYGIVATKIVAENTH